MADAPIAPLPLRSEILDPETMTVFRESFRGRVTGLASRAWYSWWQRVAEVATDLVARMIAIEGMLTDVVPGVGEPGKALVLDANGDIVSGVHSFAVDSDVRWDDIELFKEAAGVLTGKTDSDGDLVLRLRHTGVDYSEIGWDTIIGGSVAVGPVPALTGHVRLTQAASVSVRNYNNDGDLDVVEVYDDGHGAGHPNIIKFGDVGAMTLFKTSGAIPTDFLPEGLWWVSYTASTATISIRVGGVTRTLVTIAF